ncbi:MAG TPA: hypothetical protein VNH11_09250 [Pirellulales bacterium]|nr:hypothetical protein [Pirellulales bacterium]
MPEPLSPADLAARVPEGATASQCVEMWIDLMNACDEFLLSALRREVGPEGDVMAAYRRWYWQQMDEHDQAMFRMLQRLDDAWKDDGR